MPKPIQLKISYNEYVRFSYTVDTFNQCLHVKLGRGVPDSFQRDAVCEAYDHYNGQHRDAEFINPSAVVMMDEAFESLKHKTVQLDKDLKIVFTSKVAIIYSGKQEVILLHSQAEAISKEIKKHYKS